MSRATGRVRRSPKETIKRATFSLGEQEFIAMDSAREHPFTFTPAMSIVVDCDRAEELDELYAKLSDGGTILMPLQAYPFSARFGWVDDRFGVSWQLNLVR
jgi:predicted 3-demethylubiquinone-9 3-methyltransferase (glyoxalase superfamily)